MIFGNIFIFLYIFYCFFGYNFLNRLIEKKKIDYWKFNPKAYSFIGKRLVMLSHLDFLYAAYFFYYPNNERYLNLVILQIVINSGYYIIWGISEWSTFLMHLFWGLVIVFYGINYIDNFYISLKFENYTLIILLLPYYYFTDYIYTKRHYLYDNP